MLTVVLLLTLSSGHGGDAAAETVGDTAAAVVVLESSSSFSSEEAAADELPSSPSLRLFFPDRRCVDAVAVAEHIVDCRSRGSLWLQRIASRLEQCFFSVTTSLTHRVRKVSGGWSFRVISLGGGA